MAFRLPENGGGWYNANAPSNTHASGLRRKPFGNKIIKAATIANPNNVAGVCVNVVSGRLFPKLIKILIVCSPSHAAIIFGKSNGKNDANNDNGVSIHERNGMASAFTNGLNTGNKPNKKMVATPPIKVAAHCPVIACFKTR